MDKQLKKAIYKVLNSLDQIPTEVLDRMVNLISFELLDREVEEEDERTN